MTITDIMGEQPQPVTHVIFDMDGLLLDTEPRYEKAINRICRKYGSEYTLEAMRLTLGRTARGAAESVITNCNLPISIDQFVEEIELIYPEIFKDAVDLMPGVERLVKHLKEHNIPICIATSSKNSTFKLKSKHYPEFFKMFSHIVRGSDDPEVKRGKPDPDIFIIAANRFSPPPVDMKSCLVFEDSANGVKAGRAAGMQVVWVPPSCVDPSSASATLIVDSLEEFDPTVFGLPAYKQ